jgi:hypothetical protein
MWALVFIVLGVSALSAAPVFSAGTHACDYLSRDEVAAVLGTTIGDVQSQPANPIGQSICFFDIPADMAVRFAQLQMFRTSWAKHPGDSFKASALFENNMSFLDNLREISGVGDKAYWGGSGMKLGAGLHVLYQDAYFNVQAATGDADRNLEKSKALALLVLPKIK